MNDLPVLGFGQFLPSRQGLGHGFAPVRQIDEKTVWSSAISRPSTIRLITSC